MQAQYLQDNITENNQNIFLDPSNNLNSKNIIFTLLSIKSVLKTVCLPS